MPASAYALVGFFTFLSILAGIVAWRVVRPGRGPAAAVLPVVVAFVALYVIGHRLGVSAGPQVQLFGFEVSIAVDVAAALVAAFGTAALQRAFEEGRPARAADADRDARST